MKYDFDQDFADKIDSEGFDYFFAEYTSLSDLPDEIAQVVAEYRVARYEMIDAISRKFENEGVDFDV